MSFLASALSHRDEDVQVETVIRLPEEKDENETEETGAGQTPVEPRQLWMTERKRRKKMFEVRFFCFGLWCDNFGWAGRWYSLLCKNTSASLTTPPTSENFLMNLFSSYHFPPNLFILLSATLFGLKYVNTLVFLYFLSGIVFPRCIFGLLVVIKENSYLDKSVILIYNNDTFGGMTFDWPAQNPEFSNPNSRVGMNCYAGTSYSQACNWKTRGWYSPWFLEQHVWCSPNYYSTQWLSKKKNA